MTRRTCGHAWPGRYPPWLKPGSGHPADRHQCCRPPGHPGHHACACGERP